MQPRTLSRHSQLSGQSSSAAQRPHVARHISCTSRCSVPFGGVSQTSAKLRRQAYWSAAISLHPTMGDGQPSSSQGHGP